MEGIGVTWREASRGPHPPRWLGVEGEGRGRLNETVCVQHLGECPAWSGDEETCLLSVLRDACGAIQPSSGGGGHLSVGDRPARQPVHLRGASVNAGRTGSWQRGFPVTSSSLVLLHLKEERERNAFGCMGLY